MYLVVSRSGEMVFQLYIYQLKLDDNVQYSKNLSKIKETNKKMHENIIVGRLNCTSTRFFVKITFAYLAPIVVPDAWFSQKGDYELQKASNCMDDIVFEGLLYATVALDSPSSEYGRPILSENKCI